MFCADFEHDVGMVLVQWGDFLSALFVGIGNVTPLLSITMTNAPFIGIKSLLFYPSLPVRRTLGQVVKSSSSRPPLPGPPQSFLPVSPVVPPQHPWSSSTAPQWF